MIAVALFAAAALSAQQIRYVAPLNSPTGYQDYYQPARLSRVYDPARIAIGRDGSVYFTSQNTISRITPGGILEPMSSASNYRDESDGGPSVITGFDTPYALAADAGGNLYVATHHEPFRGALRNTGSIRRIGPDGRVSTVTRETKGSGIAIGPDGALYVAGGPRVWRVRPSDGATAVIAGTGEKGSDGDGGPALAARTDAYDIAVAPDGTVYLAEPYAHRVRKFTTDGAITAVAGTGEQGFSGDGGPAAEARLQFPFGLALDGAGNLYIADYGNNRVRLVTPDGMIYTVAGGDIADYWGDGVPATSARLSAPVGVAIDANGHLLIADSGNARIRVVDPQGAITTLAGCGGRWSGGCAGDGGPVRFAEFASPRGMAEDAAGNVYVADEENHRVRRIAADGTVTTVAGNGESGFTGDGGPAAEARLSFPADVALDLGGNLYIADRNNHRIRRVNPAGIIDTVAGTGRVGSAGDGGPAAVAELTGPEGIATHRDGSLYIADTVNHKIRRVAPDGVVTTVAGTGVPGSEGDGGPAIQAQLLVPKGIAVSEDGAIHVADYSAHRVRRIDAAGRIDTVSLGRGPTDLALDTSGTLFIAYNGNPEVRLLLPGGEEQRLDLRDRFGSSYYAAVAGLAATSGGSLMFSDGIGLMTAVRSPAALPPALPLLTWAGASTSGSARALSPGLIVTLYGQDIGPEAGIAATVVEGKLPVELGGIRVLFNGAPAPLLWARSDQINAVAPFALKPGELIDVEVEYRGNRSNRLILPMVEAIPGVFSGAVLNQDYSVNSYNRSARPGEVLMFWATGFGAVDPPIADGQVQTGVLPEPLLPVSVTIGGQPAQVQYAGAAPGFVAGAFQVNVVVPEGATPNEWGVAELVVRAGATPSQSRTSIYVTEGGE